MDLAFVLVPVQIPVQLDSEHRKALDCDCESVPREQSSRSRLQYPKAREPRALILSPFTMLQVTVNVELRRGQNVATVTNRRFVCLGLFGSSLSFLDSELPGDC